MSSELLDSVLDAHGGLANWDHVSAVIAEIAVGGPFWALRGWPEEFAKRVLVDVFAAVEKYVPDHTPGAVPPPELAAIRQDIIVDGWGTRIDSSKTVAHVAALRRIYADHWLARRLAETDDILSSGAALGAAFDGEQHRVNARVKRLTRSRNAAIHGGPLSDAACGSIADFATTLARQALNTTIWAIATGQQVDAYATSRRDEFRQRILKLTRGGDLANLHDR